MHGKCDDCGKEKKVYAAIDGKKRCSACQGDAIGKRLASGTLLHGGPDYVAR